MNTKIIKYLLTILRYSLLGLNIKKNTYIGRRCKFKCPSNVMLEEDVSIRPFVDVFCDEIKIGKGSDIGTRTRFDGKVIIDSKVLIAPDCYISSVDHDYEKVDLPIMDSGIKNMGKVNIGEGSWIGIHSVIIGNISIGRHVIVAANSVVTKDIPDYCVVAGIPARIIKRYDINRKKWEKI